jgi:hypothetical protein
MSIKKIITFFHLIFYFRAKNIRFIIRAPTPLPALVIKRLFLALEKTTVKKSFTFFIEQIVISAESAIPKHEEQFFPKKVNL